MVIRDEIQGVSCDKNNIEHQRFVGFSKITVSQEKLDISMLRLEPEDRN